MNKKQPDEQRAQGTQPHAGNFSVDTATTPGPREANQDRVFRATTTIAGRHPAIVLAVADGMGGMQSGDRAAELAVETVERYVREVFPELPESQASLRSAIGAMYQEANRRIWDEGRANNTSGMGTTLVFCLTFDRRYVVANAGDSRCYYINNYEAHQITEDHSKVQELVRAGAMTTEAARRSPYRSQLTNSLGEPVDIPVDLFPEGSNWGVMDEDCVLLLCSDGLHGWVSEAQMFAALHRAPTLATSLDALLKLALDNGSTDNVTVAAVECGRLGRRQASGPRRPSRTPLVIVLSLIATLLFSAAWMTRDRLLSVAHRILRVEAKKGAKKGK